LFTNASTCGSVICRRKELLWLMLLERIICFSYSYFVYLILESKCNLKSSLLLAKNQYRCSNWNIHAVNFSIGIIIFWVAASRHSCVKPVASVPTTSAVGLV
jgi:hypothetical protein